MPPRSISTDDKTYLLKGLSFSELHLHHVIEDWNRGFPQV